MTSLNLLLWIVLSFALQLAVYLGIAFWRHWLEYLSLRQRVADDASAPAIETQISPEPSASMASAWTGLRAFRISRIVIEDALGMVRSFYLVPEDGRPLPSYRAGQFLTISLDIPAATGGAEPIVRCYTLSDAPRGDGYRISVKRVVAGKASNFLHDHLGVGDILQVRAPSGHFHIDQGNAPVVLIGGGIGVTPMLSMVNWSLANQPQREIWLFYGVRNSSEAIMLPHLEELAATHPNFHLRLCYSAPRSDDLNGRINGIHGRVDVKLLRLQLPLKPFHFYICGPTQMLEGLVPALEEWGVPPARIHFEAFGPASIKHSWQTLADTISSFDGSEVIVTFARSGKQIPWRPEARSLLEFAEANAVSINSGCRAGGCGSCQTTIWTGEVTYRHPPDFDPEPGACLMCVCVPKTSVTLEA